MSLDVLQAPHSTKRNPYRTPIRFSQFPPEWHIDADRVFRLPFARSVVKRAFERARGARRRLSLTGAAHKEDDDASKDVCPSGSTRHLLPQWRRSSNGKIIQPALAWLAAVLTLVSVADANGLAQDVAGTFVPIEVPGA